MKKGGLAFALIALSLCPATLASAASLRHHRGHRLPLYRRDIGGYMDQAFIRLHAEPSIGTWRYQLLQPHCDDSYPMMESSCGTATGGPVGGMGS